MPKSRVSEGNIPAFNEANIVNSNYSSSKERTLEGFTSLDSFNSSSKIFKALAKIYDPFKLKNSETLYFIKYNKSKSTITPYLIDSTKESKLELDYQYLISCFKVFDKGDQLIISHNHPSGISLPSLFDYNFTEIIAKICKRIKLNFVDHIIFCEKEYYSFNDSGLLTKIKNRID